MTDTYSHYSRLVENYRRYRPRYPAALLAWLESTCGFTPAQVVADIGSGTGQMAELFLQNGNPVYAVEPNDEMRWAAEVSLRHYPQFTSVGATAEATTLPDDSIHLITVGNAFHWFKHDETRHEFVRILQPQGWVALLWNLERNNGSRFAMAFEQFWQTHLDPAARFIPFQERKLPGYVGQFFGANHFQQTSFDNTQMCDYDALQGLCLSTLKAPQEDDPHYRLMLADLKMLFDQHQENGMVTLEYDTAVIFGQLNK